jgi:hypothetical protein
MTMRQSISPDDDIMMSVSIETNGIKDAMLHARANESC